MNKLVKYAIILTMIMMFILSSMPLFSQKNTSCLFKNPLCFYANDILTYLQVMHKQGLYERMIPFLYTPIEIKQLGKKKILMECEKMSFGYEMKRVGIQEIIKNKEWMLTYQRVILGTSEIFRLHCILIDDTVRINSPLKERKMIFNRTIQ